MLRRIHSILLLFALLIGGAGMNYVQAANVTLTVTASPAAGGQVRIANGAWTTSTNGTTSRSVPQSTPMGISAQAASGYRFSQWNDGNTSANRPVQITKNTTYTATFIPNTVTLTVTSNNTNYGTVTGGGTYNYNTSVTLTATPKTGYHFVQWSDGNTNASRTVTATANASYQATFAINQYTITFKNEDGTTLKTQTVDYNVKPTPPSNPTQAATAQYTYTFKAWSPTIVAATANATYTATYTATTRSYTIRFLNGSTVLQSNTLKYGTTPSYTGSTPTKSSTAQYSYTFSGWSPAIYAVNKAQDYTAQFSQTVRSYKITGKSADNAMGTVSGTATKQYNQTVTLTATPKDCYKFVQWTDGNTSNPRTVTVSGTATYTATFEETISGNCGANGSNVKWYFNSCTGAMRIVGTGAMANYSSNSAVPWYNRRTSITSVTIASGVTNIGTHAFSDCSNLSSVSIPASVTAIGNWAFSSCYAMESLYITDLAAWCSISFGTYYSSPFSRNVNSSYLGGGNLYVNNTKVTTLTIPNGVTAIFSYAFMGFAGITSIQFNKATTIGAHAFAGCHGLTNVTIPSGVTTIGENSFAACTHLQSMSIPASVTSLGNMMLYNCQALTDIHVYWTGTVPTWQSNFTNKSPQSSITLHVPCGSGDLYSAANGWKDYTIRGNTQYTLTAKTPGSGYGTISIDDGTAGASVSQKIYCETDHKLTVNRTGCYYFTQWSDGNTDNPRTVRINSNATYNAQFSNTFSGTCGATGNEANVQWSLNTCTGVLSITGTGAMADYSSTNQPWYPYREFFTSVTIANGVTRIGNNAFNNCSNLTTVTIPPSVTSIANYAFSGCYAMESLYITDLTAWCNISFGSSSSSPFCRNDYHNHEGGGNLYVNGTKVTTLTIPNGVTVIPDYAFFGFAGITDIQFNQTTTIGSYAFACCLGLANVTIPEGVTTIGNKAFAYCPHLLTMSIPASVTSIGTEMMYNCQAQTDIYVHWTKNVPAWSSFTTKSPQTDITLHVPTCKQLLYTGGWANYTLDTETEERTVSIASNNATYGLVQYEDETPVASIEKQMPCTTSFVVKAIPAEGYHFVEWSDGLLQGTRQLGNLENDTALIALFGPGVPPEIYDDQVGFTQQGALSGAFSVSETQVVYFSQGPLQFNASLGTHECADGTTKPGTWRFAEHQYDVVGDLNAGNVYENGVKCSNTLASATYTGWQDMYCWGASGYNGIEPYKANRPSTTSIAGTNYDWGVYNAISNGGNTPGLWRTPTKTEWDYMFNQRPNALELNAPAMVEGMYGLVVLPDDWDPPAGLSLVTTSTQYYTDNVFSAAQWQEMENAGAVFIPSGGWFSWNSSMWISSFRNTGELWASTGSSTSSQHDVQWGNDRQAYLSASSTHVLEQLRLVSDVGGYTKVRFVGIDSHGDKFVIAYIYVPYGATPVPPEVPERECYTFTGWDRTISPANGRMTTYTAQYEDLIYSGTFGADGDNLTWTLNACDSTLIISGTGAMANYSAGGAPWNEHKDAIHTVTFADGINTIGENAFAGFTNLTDIYAPWTENIPVLPASNNPQSSVTLHIACSAISDYQAAGWGNYTVEAEYTASGICGAEGDNLTWTLCDDGTLTIRGTGEMKDWSVESAVPWYAYKDAIRSVVINEGVTRIGSYAFKYCNKIVNVSIPSSTTSIGIWAFDQCTGVEGLHISDLTAWCTVQFESFASNPLYYAAKPDLYVNDELIVNLVIPEGVTSIYKHAFQHCSAQTITLPEGLQIIGEGNASAFAYTTISSITIPQSVTYLGRWSFTDNDNLTDIYVYWTENIPAWNNMTNKSPQSNITLHVPCGTASLYQAADGWKSYTIVEDMPNIKSGTYGPDNIEWSFDYCDSTLSITGNGELRCDDNTWGPNAGGINPNAVKYVFIGKGVTYLGIYTLSYMTNIEYIEIEEGHPTHRTGCNAIIRIGSEQEGDTLIFGCPHTVIPTTCTTIRGYGFSDNHRVTEMTIPSSVKQIANMQGPLWEGNNGQVFYTSNSASEGLKDLYVEWTKLEDIPVVPNNRLGDMNKVRLHVPCGTTSLYKQVTGWSKFKEYIEESATFTITVQAADPTMGDVSIIVN